MKISILKKDKILNESINQSISNKNTVIYKSDFTKVILISKVIVSVIYAFGLGYSLFFLGDDYIKVGIKFLILLIIMYGFIAFLYSLLKALCLPKAFNKNIIKIQLNPYTMSIDVLSKIKIDKVKIIFSMMIPFMLLTIIPTIVSYILEFNIYLYVLASSSAIIATEDLIYLILIIKNESKENKIKLSTNEFTFYS